MGVGSGLGYAAASRLLQVKLGRGFIAAMAGTALADYAAAQYVTYANLLEQNQVGAEHYPFTQYVRDSCEKMSFSSRNGNGRGAELGMFGYLFKFLELGGYVLGATLPSGLVSGLPYCRACQKYLKKHRTAFVNSPTLWLEAAKLGKKDREPVLQAAVGPLVARADELCQRMAAASLAETDALLAGLDAKAAADAAAHLSIVLNKCPSCDGHLVNVSLVNRTVDKQTANNIIRTLDKIEAPAPTAAAEG